MKCEQITAIAALVMVAGMTALPAKASEDRKMFSVQRCQPVGPATTDAELRYSAVGVQNPGTTNETIVCELPVDSDTPWATDGSAGSLEIYYRGGATDSSITCTLYVGSNVLQASPNFSQTYGPVAIPANARGTIYATLDYPEGFSSFLLLPSTLRCVLGGGVSLGGVWMREASLTDTP